MQERVIHMQMIFLTGHRTSDVTEKEKKVENGRYYGATRRAAQADRGQGRVRNYVVQWKCGVYLVPPLEVWRGGGKGELLVATRHGMHSMAYQLRSWCTNE